MMGQSSIAPDRVVRTRAPKSDAMLLAVCAVVVVGAVTASAVVTLVMCAAALGLVRVHRRSLGIWTVVAVIGLGSFGAMRSAAENRALSAAVLGAHDGWVSVRGDPRTYRSATRLVVSVDGQRFEIWGRGSQARRTFGEFGDGDRLHLVGERRALSPQRATQVAWQHVIGEYRLESIVDHRVGPGVARFGNAVRAVIGRGAGFIPEADRALFSGLVIGDRRGQSPAVVERFRESGLSHLVVVSGLNVTMLLLAVSPVLVRLTPFIRWLVTLVILAWFAGLTRFEPSIMRASVMAAISVTAFTTGRDRDPTRMLMLAVTILVTIDPVLVRSIGLWLSVGATAGVCAIGPRLSTRIRAWHATRTAGKRRAVVERLIDAVAITAGAQVGVAVPLIATFGSIPVVSIPANLLAVPVASAVKLYGLPASMIAGVVPAIGPWLMFPAALGTAFVDRVARAAAALEPGGLVSWVIWSFALVGVAAVVRIDRNRASGATTGVRDGRVPADRRR
jgi:competence protein ComEC